MLKKFFQMKSELSVSEIVEDTIDFDLFDIQDTTLEYEKNFHGRVKYKILSKEYYSEYKTRFDPKSLDLQLQKLNDEATLINSIKNIANRLLTIDYKLFSTMRISNSNQFGYEIVIKKL